METARRIRGLIPMAVVAVLASATTLGLVRLAGPAAGTAHAGGDETQPLVRARRFELVDAAGRVRGVLNVNPAGLPGLALLDEAGAVRLLAAANAQGGYGVSVRDPGGAIRFAAGGGGEQGFVGVNVRDGAGRIRANLFASDDGSAAAVQTWDEAGRVRAFMGACPGLPSGFHTFETVDTDGPFDPCPGP